MTTLQVTSLVELPPVIPLFGTMRLLVSPIRIKSKSFGSVSPNAVAAACATFVNNPCPISAPPCETTMLPSLP